ncbi:MAG TPA: LysM peptidoglycan-binding domain-containing protein [Steroidobacteraceae bacterium]|nr:LysM peptidoglycan-binding domain-containing protein [Steroidobacteraceae bacterium]
MRRFGLTLWVLSLLLAATDLYAAEDLMPRPPELERDVQFWVRVYSEVDTNSGFLHDERNLGVVYETLHFAPNTPPREREKILDQDRSHYAAALRRIAASHGEPLSEEDQHIKDMWGEEGTPARLLEATDEIRFQLGQSDRFRAGLVRSGAWETHIAETLANLGLPAELAVLPHVESSFNPAAYSKVGAAGLWQFMRSTGRRYMRIDSAVDDRLDPFRATEAAAQLLAYNYRLLGTWPLALTAYNHGAEGVRRAKETLGTDDIVKIVRNYKGRTFGFASRNFYVSFLAALQIDRNPEKYFGNVERASEARFQEVTVPAFVPIGSLERALKIDRQRLRDLNPALLRSVWDGQRHVPKAYHLRLPIDGPRWTSDELALRLAPNELYAGQPEPRRYRVREGDTIASIAEANGVTAETLARLNRLRTSARLKPGRSLSLPGVTQPALVAASSIRSGSTAVASTTGSSSAGTSTGRNVKVDTGRSATVTAGAGTASAGAASAGAASAGTTGEGTASAVTASGAPASGTASASSSAGAVSATATGAGATATTVASSSGATATATSGSAPRGGAGTAPAVAPSQPGVYVVQRGDSLSEIASKAGMTEAQLMSLNGIRNRDFIFEGQQLQIAPAALASTTAPAAASPTTSATNVTPPRTSASGSTTASTVVPTTNLPTPQQLSGAVSPPGADSVPVVAGGAVPAAEAQRESAEEAAAVAKVPAENDQPVSAAQAEELSPALGPAADIQQNADPTDYSVGKNDTIRVAAAETLGHYAEWLGLTAARLRQLNHMSFGRPVLIGRKLKLDFARVSREDFESKRREYHQNLQAAYFAANRIIGTEVYIVRSGDKLWNLTQRFGQLPIWLVQQYNPDVDLADLHPGTQIVMPRVEEVVAGPN